MAIICGFHTKYVENISKAEFDFIAPELNCFHYSGEDKKYFKYKNRYIICHDLAQNIFDKYLIVCCGSKFKYA